MFVDHIAFLTQNLQQQSDALPAFCHKQAIERFPAEGTQEQYIVLEKASPKLLLLQPIAEGPYARALQKRGPGLHHLGAITPSLEARIPELVAWGLRLHPISIQSLHQGVAWLCHSDLPFLIELTERDTQAAEPIAEHVERVELGLPAGTSLPAFVAELFANLHLFTAASAALELKLGQQRLQLPLA